YYARIVEIARRSRKPRERSEIQRNAMVRNVIARRHDSCSALMSTGRCRISCSHRAARRGVMASKPETGDPRRSDKQPFLTDVKTLRQRARQTIDEGPGPEDKRAH